MYRRRLDLLISSAGLIVTVVLLALGGLLIRGNTFVDNQVHEQLAAQKIFFPPKGSPAIKGPQFAAMQQYAGQQLTTGPQAQTYANDFIAVHLSEVAGGKTYAQVSGSNRRLSLIHISEPTRLGMISYAVFCLKKKKKQNKTTEREAQDDQDIPIRRTKPV